MTVEQAVSTLSRRPRIDRVLTHPAFEAAKMCIRCVPFVASFVYLLDRITQWKLSYASNDVDIQQIEKKANDITVTLISMIELLPPEERHQDNPKIKMFKKRIEEIRIIQKYMVEFILEFEQTSDKKKVFFAERNRGIVQMLRQTLSDIERDIQTQLQFHANTSLKVQGLKLNAMGQILYELRRQLSEQGEKNDCLIALISNQIDTTSQALERLEERLVNTFTPGYVDVRNLEIKDMWWNFFRWPARIPLKQFARCFPDYFERKDADAYTIMSLFRARNLWGLKDLGIPRPPTPEVTPSLLDISFPTDDVHGMTLGDWVIWRLEGWMFLTIQHEQQLYQAQKDILFGRSHLKKFIADLEAVMNRLRHKFGYSETLHNRLLQISCKLASQSLSKFSDRFEELVMFLEDSLKQLQESRKDIFVAENYVEQFSHRIVNLQMRLAACANDLGEDVDLWRIDEVDELIRADDDDLNQHYVPELKASYIDLHVGIIKDRLIISHHTIQDVVDKENGTFHGTWCYQSVEMAPLHNEDIEVLAQALQRVAIVSSFSFCPYVRQFHGLTLYDSIWMTVAELPSRGTLRSLLSSTDQNFAWSSRVRIATQVAIALFFLHNHQYAHLGLSSCIIYLTKGLDAKIGGLWDLPDASEAWKYYPPEGLDAAQEDGMLGLFQANVYSLGVILYELATLSNPYDEYSVQPEEPLPFPSLSSLPNSTPEPFIELIRCCLEVEPERRPKMYEVVEVLNQLERLTEADLCIRVDEYPSKLNHNGMVNRSDSAYEGSNEALEIARDPEADTGTELGNGEIILGSNNYRENDSPADMYNDPSRRLGTPSSHALPNHHDRRIDPATYDASYRTSFSHYVNHQLSHDVPQRPPSAPVLPRSSSFRNQQAQSYVNGSNHYPHGDSNHYHQTLPEVDRSHSKNPKYRLKKFEGGMTLKRSNSISSVHYGKSLQIEEESVELNRENVHENSNEIHQSIPTNVGSNESKFMFSQSDSAITPASVHTSQHLHPPRGASNFEQHPSRQIESVNLSPGQTNAFDTRSSNSRTQNSTDSRPYPLILPGHVQANPESSIHNPLPQRQIQAQLHAQDNQEISANTKFSHPPVLQTHNNRSSFSSHHQQEHLLPRTASNIDSKRPQSVPPLGIRQDTTPLQTQPQTQQSTASVINLSDISDPSVPPVSQSKSPNSLPSTLDQINLSVPPLPRVDTNIPALSLMSDDAPLLSPEELDSLLDHKSADTHKSEESHNIIPASNAPAKQDMDGVVKDIILSSEDRKSPENEIVKQEKRSSHGMFKRMLNRSNSEDVKLGEDEPEAVKGENQASFNDASIIDLPKSADLKRKKSKKRKLQPPLPPKELNRYPTPIEPKNMGPQLTPPESPFPNRISLPSPLFSEKELPVPSQLPNLPDLSPLKIPLTPISPSVSTSKSAPSLSRTPSMASLIPTLSRSMKSAKLLQNDDTTSSISDSSDPSSPVSDPAKRQKSIETLNTALQFYRNGSGDFSAAYALFQKAAKQGNSFAYFYMGECHYHGSKVSNFRQDFTKAFEFYSKAVASTSESSLTPPPISPHEVPESCYLGYIGLADCHFFGFAPDTDRDPKKAYSYYNTVLSIVTNHQQKYSHVSPLPQGLTPKLLSRVYAGVADIFYDQSEYVNAVYMYQKAIQLDPGCKRAMTRLAVCMFLGVGGVQKDVDEGRKLLRKVRGVKREVEAWILYYKEIGDEVMVNKYEEESKRFVDY